MNTLPTIDRKAPNRNNLKPALPETVKPFHTFLCVANLQELPSVFTATQDPSWIALIWIPAVFIAVSCFVRILKSKK